MGTSWAEATFYLVICDADASSSGKWLPMASGLAVGFGSQVTDRYLDLAFSLYLPGKGCSECPELPGAGKSSNRTAPLGLRELPPGGEACSRRGLGSGPRRERVYQSLGVRMNAPASNSLPTAESRQEVRVWARK